MKSKLVTLLVYFLAISFVARSQRSNQGFIEILHQGAESKPYPRVYLYVTGPVTKEIVDEFTLTFKISEETFKQISTSILGVKPILLDTTTISGAYEFTVFHNRETTVFYTSFMSRIQQTFDSVISILKDIDTQKLVSKELTEAMDRLKADNR